MYLRIGNRIVNTEAMTDAEIVEKPDGKRTVIVTTSAVERVHDGSLASRRIMLSGGDAELFLSALPTYSPVLEPEIEGEGLGMRVIDAASARQIVAELDTGKLARAAWRATVPDGSGSGRFALVALDLASAELVLVAWSEGAAPPPPALPLVVLVSSDSEAHERTRERLGSGLDVPPSAEVIEETVVRDARLEAEAWTHVEEQLARIYARPDAEGGAERVRRQEEGAV